MESLSEENPFPLFALFTGWGSFWYVATESLCCVFMSEENRLYHDIIITVQYNLSNGCVFILKFHKKRYENSSNIIEGLQQMCRGS